MLLVRSRPSASAVRSTHGVVADGYIRGEVVTTPPTTASVHQALPVAVRGTSVEREAHGPAVGHVAVVPAHPAPGPRAELHLVPVGRDGTVSVEDPADHHVEPEGHSVLPAARQHHALWPPAAGPVELVLSYITSEQPVLEVAEGHRGLGDEGGPTRVPGKVVVSGMQMDQEPVHLYGNLRAKATRARTAALCSLINLDISLYSRGL